MPQKKKIERIGVGKRGAGKEQKGKAEAHKVKWGRAKTLNFDRMSTECLIQVESFLQKNGDDKQAWGWGASRSSNCFLPPPLVSCVCLGQSPNWTFLSLVFLICKLVMTCTLHGYSEEWEIRQTGRWMAVWCIVGAESMLAAIFESSYICYRHFLSSLAPRCQYSTEVRTMNDAFKPTDLKNYSQDKNLKPKANLEWLTIASGCPLHGTRGCHSHRQSVRCNADSVDLLLASAFKEA